MNKKIVGIFICILMITTGILPIVGSEIKTTMDSVEENDCGCPDNTYNMIYIPPPIITEIPDFSTIETNESSIALIDTPEYFNWMDYEGQDWTTSAKEQNLPKSCGSCFIFAALGALESVINIREGLADLDPDLSEQYVLSCLPKAGNCIAGDFARVFKYIQSSDSDGNNCNGIIPEACFPYQADDTIPCDAKWENWQEYLIPILSYGLLPAGNFEMVKSAIMQKGPVVANFYQSMNFVIWSMTHHSPEDYFPYEDALLINHVVLIVGWKDDPSIGQGGYWICKNSRVPTWGYHGFFNIEYRSLNINSGSMAWVDYDPESYDWHPTPKVYGPYYGLTNQLVQFTGDASGEHPPFTWLWEFGDGATSEEQNPTHTYLSAGDYTVTLTVTDLNGKSFNSTTSVWIQETNQPPETPNLEGPSKVKVGENCWYSFTMNDPEGNLIYVYWECFNLSTNIWDGPYPSNSSLKGYKNWTESGSFTVRVKAKDAFGAESDWATLEVSVSKNKVYFTTPFQQFLEMHPNLYPLLQQLINV